MIFTATFLPVTQWTPSFTSPETENKKLVYHNGSEKGKKKYFKILVQILQHDILRILLYTREYLYILELKYKYKIINNTKLFF